MRPLHMAAWYGHQEAVRMLINAGASVAAVNKVRDYYQSTPLHESNSLSPVLRS